MQSLSLNPEQSAYNMVNHLMINIHGNTWSAQVGSRREDVVGLPCDQQPVIDVAMCIRHVCLLLIMSPFPIHNELVLQPPYNNINCLTTITDKSCNQNVKKVQCTDDYFGNEKVNANWMFSEHWEFCTWWYPGERLQITWKTSDDPSTGDKGNVSCHLHPYELHAQLQVLWHLTFSQVVTSTPSSSQQSSTKWEWLVDPPQSYRSFQINLENLAIASLPGKLLETSFSQK